MSTPWLSVVMPTYNGEAFLIAALESIIAQQDGGDFEVIAGDDGSTDGTMAALAAYSSRLPLRIVRRPRTGRPVCCCFCAPRTCRSRRDTDISFA